MKRRVRRNGPGAIIGSVVGIVVVGVIGYIVYKKMKSRSTAQSTPASSSGNDASASAASSNLQTIQHVTKGEKLATLSTEIITAKLPNMKYDKISSSSQDPDGHVLRYFTATVDGYMTGRLLQSGTNMYAEIRPG